MSAWKNRPERSDAKLEVRNAGELPILSVRGVSYSYGDKSVLRSISFDLREASGLAVRGANGAGKTTLLKVIAGLLKPDSGEVVLCGIDVGKYRQRTRRLMGYVSDAPFFYERLTGAEYLGVMSRSYGGSLERAVQFVGRLGVGGSQLSQGVDTYSLGTRQKVALAISMCYSPRLLLLDEPFAALDDVSREIAIALCLKHIDAGNALIMVSHNNSEVESVANAMAVLSDGEIDVSARAWRR